MEYELFAGGDWGQKSEAGGEAVKMEVNPKKPGRDIQATTEFLRVLDLDLNLRAKGSEW